MARAIEHIEAHLCRSSLQANDAAAAAGVSVFHLHRLFTAVFGHSIGAYIRKRRLTEASILLRTTERGVLDIALACAFESQASFTRAFRALFHEPPARYRRNARPWYPGFHRPDVPTLVHLKGGGLTLAPRMVALPEDVVVRGRGEAVDLDRELEIVAQWARVLPAIAAGGAPRRCCCYGVVLPAHEDVPLGPAHSLVYLAGVQVADESAAAAEAAGLDARALPHVGRIGGGGYAVFEHRGPPEQMRATLDYVWATWLPKSGLRKSARADFERFDLAVSDTAAAPPVIEIWLAVEGPSEAR